MERQRDCPKCKSREFYRVASTLLHLGEKVKWRCTSCGYGFVQIDGAIDSTTA